MVSTATDTRERMEVVAGPKPAPPPKAPLAESADPAANIYKRLWRIEQELEAVEKSQTATVKMEGGGQYTYKYSGHDLILAFVRPLFAKHGVKFWPSTIKHERTGNLSVVTVRIEFVNVDDPKDTTFAEITNYGADKGDKGATKALTNAVREGIKKALNITSEEDKFADEHTDFQSAEGATREDVEAAKEQRRAAIQQWAATFKSALESAPDLKTVRGLERENRDQLTSADLPGVTRSFFAELITQRKRTLTPLADGPPDPDADDYSGFDEEQT